MNNIYFKLFFLPGALNNANSFYHLCDKLKDFPLVDNDAEIIGLFLSGNYYSRKILFSGARKVPADEIKKIKSIAPIIERKIIPFILEQDYFEVTIPTDKGLEDLFCDIVLINSYLNELFKENNGKKIEIHFQTPLTLQKDFIHIDDKKILKVKKNGKISLYSDNILWFINVLRRHL